MESNKYFYSDIKSSPIFIKEMFLEKIPKKYHNKIKNLNDETIDSILYNFEGTKQFTYDHLWILKIENENIVVYMEGINKVSPYSFLFSRLYYNVYINDIVKENYLTLKELRKIIKDDELIKKLFK